MEMSCPKPPKLRRLEDPTTVAWELRERVRQLTRLSLWSYYRTTNSHVAVDDVFVCVHNLLRRMNCNDGSDGRAPLLAQVHGLLLQWLDYIITQHPQLDITNEDEISMTKVTRSVVHICCCLKDVYRCSPKLYHLEGLLVTVRALLTTTARSIDEPIGNIIPSAQIPMLSLLLQVVQNVDANQLPASFTQQFVLVLLEASSRHAPNNQVSSTAAGEPRASPPPTDSNRASTISWSILLHLASQSSTNNGISGLAQIALSMLNSSQDELQHCFSLDNILFNDPIEIFRLQGVLRLASPPSHDVVVVEILLKAALDAASVPGCRFQAMDSLITLAGRTSPRCLEQVSDKPSLLPSPSMEDAIMKAFTKILSTTSSRFPASSTDHLIQFLAVDGLRRLLSNDEMLKACLQPLKKNPNQARHLMLSLVQVACRVRRQYYPNDEYNDDDCWSSIAHQCHYVDNTVEMAAAEIVLSILQVVGRSTEEGNHSLQQPVVVSSTDVATIYQSLLDQRCEHVTYLTVRTICDTTSLTGTASTPTPIFLDVMERHPELSSSLAKVLQIRDHRQNTNNVMPQTRERILVFWLHLLQVRPRLVPVLARQEGVLAALASVVGTSNSQSTPAIRDLATALLMELGADVCNRRLLARTHRVLASLIQYAREHLPHPHDNLNNNNNNATSTSANPEPSQPLFQYSREMFKERILQLAQVL